MDREARLNIGKLPVSLLRSLIRNSGKKRKEVLLGPNVGEDAAAVGVGDRFLVVATDPVTFTSTHAGWYAVHINANDVAVCGARPLYFQSCIILPEGSKARVPLALAREIAEAARSLGVAVTGGHTEVSRAVRQPVIIGTMMGLTKRVLSSGGAAPGNLLIQIGFAGIEGSAILASQAGSRVINRLQQSEKSWLQRNLKFPAISVVEPALAAAKCGALALHDATEGGIAAAIHEMAAASQCRIIIDIDKIMVREATRALCHHYGIDPLTLLGSGCMLAATPEARVDSLLRAARRKSWAAAVLGRIASGRGVQAISSGRRVPFPCPSRDALAELQEA